MYNCIRIILIKKITWIVMYTIAEIWRNEIKHTGHYTLLLICHILWKMLSLYCSTLSFLIWILSDLLITKASSLIGYLISLPSLSGGISSSSNVSFLDSISPRYFIIIIILFWYSKVIYPLSKYLKHLISWLWLVWVLVLPFYSAVESFLNALSGSTLLSIVFDFDEAASSLL